MKIATFNIQNLFYRNRELLQKNRSKNAADWIAELDMLLRKYPKGRGDSNRINDLSCLLGFDKMEDMPYAILKNKAGELCFTKQGFRNTAKASFLTDWEGWVKVANGPLHEKAVFSKAYVIAETDPDVLILQEVEDRASLMEFNTEFLPLLKISPYQEVMAFETNDPRGMGMGLMLKNGYRLNGVKNHLYDLDADGLALFNMDCQEYEIGTPDGDTIWVLSNQFSLDDVQRKKQAEKVAKIYNRMRSEGKMVLVCGTLNDVSYSHALSPLIRETDLKDISRHGRFKTDTDQGRDGSYFRLGAYRLGVNIKQKDYLLLPPYWFEKVQKAGMNRKGTWPDRKPNWALYPSIGGKHHAASEHPLVWGEIDL
ncbi:Endonuclease/Exonuclease/phosphatase family protein [Pricia antarctica]|uniref:Endonuclease/Exonuclease/phosphatase family protein n=1 Tax=Pricia antarctica TaxID=641691 RepID=A0A1G7HHN7_9FLAO|nr:endonuclease/exonuclease/phosphatase family protein [Pricia antarctica]SDE99935.1 Endonuclease/Exonuclease/phosphatase family protein [Pricia antarctica]